MDSSPHETKPVINTASGAVQGRYRRGATLFAGIPYAEAPIGTLRFAPPTPKQPWTGIRDARSFSKAAPQLPGEGLTSRIPVNWNEDCLSLNIVTPATDHTKRPVYVWIHGGAYQHGQGATPWYDGSSFAIRGDIVVVTINYRLGAFGFCHLSPHLGEQFESAGINGFLDQLAAINWVRENIAAFGGDPDQITIGGESAGAFSVCNLLASPEAQGLFHKAIAQSGADQNIHDPDAGEQISASFLSTLGQPTAKELLAFAPESLLEAQELVTKAFNKQNPHGIQPFYPVWGHNVLPKAPQILIREGAGSNIPALTGTNEDELALWGITHLDTEQVERYVARISDNPKALLNCYRERLGQVEPGWLACAIGTDRVFRIPAVQFAESRHTSGGATWMYQFSWDSKAFNGYFGSAHALEIPFTFNTLDAPGTDLFLGKGPRPYDLAETMHNAWIAFIREGDPSTPDLGLWPPYEPESRFVMNFAERTGLLKDPNSEERLVWDHAQRDPAQ